MFGDAWQLRRRRRCRNTKALYCNTIHHPLSTSFVPEQAIAASSNRREASPPESTFACDRKICNGGHQICMRQSSARHLEVRLESLRRVTGERGREPKIESSRSSDSQVNTGDDGSVATKSQTAEFGHRNGQRGQPYLSATTSISRPQRPTNSTSRACLAIGDTAERPMLAYRIVPVAIASLAIRRPAA